MRAFNNRKTRKSKPTEKHTRNSSSHPPADATHTAHTSTPSNCVRLPPSETSWVRSVSSRNPRVEERGDSRFHQFARHIMRPSVVRNWITRPSCLDRHDNLWIVWQHSTSQCRGSKWCACRHHANPNRNQSTRWRSCDSPLAGVQTLLSEEGFSGCWSQPRRAANSTNPPRVFNPSLRITRSL